MRIRTDTANKVVYLKPELARAARMREIAGRAGQASRRVGRGVRPLFALLFAGAWTSARIVITALLVLAEPFLRFLLCGAAFLGFLVTVLFGFLLEAPHFPKWGMLALSVGALLLYWLYLGLMSLFMRLPPSCHDRY
jgi:hypothetical protein